jgi:membrane-associated protease RseP (regulator of RpoE activity)
MRSMLVLAAVLLTGCASSGYRQFYQPMSGVTPADIAQARAAPPPKVPALEHAVGPGPQVQAAYGRRGYAMIGYSSFNSGHNEGDAGALAQGAKVQADLVVVIDPQYTGSLTSSVPITTPTTQTAYTNGSATAYGPSGPVTAYGNSTTTTYGSQTAYVPMTVNRFDYDALYFIKRGHWVFGAGCRDATDAERRSLQSNRGAYVLWVVDNTPAFKADVLAGDMIVAVDGAPVYGYEGFTDLLNQRRGHQVDVAIVRNGQSITKSVLLNN